MSKTRRSRNPGPSLSRTLSIAATLSSAALCLAGCIEKNPADPAQESTQDPSQDSGQGSGQDSNPGNNGTPTGPQDPSTEEIGGSGGAFVSPDPGGKFGPQNGWQKSSPDDKNKPEKDSSKDNEESGAEGEDDDGGNVEDGDAGSNDGSPGGSDGSKGDDGSSKDKSKKDGGKSGSKILAEADVLHVDGDLAYVLSRRSGLHVLNLQNPQQIQLLGSYALDGEAFEMYVVGTQVVVMIRELEHYDKSSQRWRSGSAVLRVDAQNPAQLKMVDELEVKGRISDSRYHDGKLYLVSYEREGCWGCEKDNHVRVLSFQAAPGQALAQLDQKTVPNTTRLSRNPTAYFRHHHLFVAIPDQRSKEGSKGRLARFDIDPKTGIFSPHPDLHPHADVLSRWQIDEHKGFLRVVSQPRWSSDAPLLETFDTSDPAKTAVLSSLTVKLPRPEELKSARFDGDRGYLITFRRTDPLFVFDLRDPKAPLQKGELEIPGWVHHMEPYGDRLLGVGYDPQNAAGRLSLSLFDVSNMDAPKQLARAHFAPKWGDFVEDQDRIHKSITVLRDKNLVLIPYSVRGNNEGSNPGVDGDWDEDDGDAETEAPVEDKEDSADNGRSSRRDCDPVFGSAIALIDWEGDALKTRGQAMVEGAARRSFLHRDHLIALSDEFVSAIDIQNRDLPKTVGQKSISQNVESLVHLGDHSLRLVQDWWSDAKRFEIVQSAVAERPESIATLPLGAVNSEACEDGRDIFFEGLRDDGQRAYLRYYSRRFKNFKGGRDGLAVIDIADPKQPKVLASSPVRRQRTNYPVIQLGRTRIHSSDFGALADRVVFASVQRSYGNKKSRRINTTFSIYRAQPDQSLQSEVVLERNNSHYAGGLIDAGNELGSWHATRSEDNESLRFFYDRFYIDPAQAFRHQAINVPGVPLRYDTHARQVWTLDFRHETADIGPAECAQHAKKVKWDWEKSKCELMWSEIKRLDLMPDGSAKLVATHDLAGAQHILSDIYAHEDRIIAVLTDPRGAEKSKHSIAIAALDSHRNYIEKRFPNLALKSLQPLNGPQFALQTSPKELVVFDARDLTNIHMRHYETPSHWCRDVKVQDRDIMCALGEYGIRRLTPVNP